MADLNANPTGSASSEPPSGVAVDTEGLVCRQKPTVAGECLSMFISSFLLRFYVYASDLCVILACLFFDLLR